MTDKLENKNVNNKPLFKQKAFIYFLISAIIWVSCVGVYGVRFIKALKGTGLNNDDEVVSLYEKITDYRKISLNGTGLVIEGDGFRFQGNVKNNYVMYSSILWRIISIDKKGNIYMVTDESIINMPYSNDQTAEYDKSLVRNFLNAQVDTLDVHSFMDELVDPDTYLIQGSYSIDEVSEINEILPYENTLEEDYVGLLTTNDYLISGGSEGFLNNGTSFYTMTKKKDSSEVFYVYQEGGMTTFDTILYDQPIYGVRPVVCLKGDTVNYIGTGKKSSPYMIESKTGQTLKDHGIGEYVNFSGYTWRIIGQSEGNVKLMLNDVYRDQNGNCEVSDFEVSDILNKFMKTLDGKDKLVMGKFFTGQFSPNTKYTQSKVAASSNKAYVGIPSAYDYFAISSLENLDGYWLANYYQKNKGLAWYVSSDGQMLTKYGDSKLAVRPVIYLAGDTSISSGWGTKRTPYELSWEVTK